VSSPLQSSVLVFSLHEAPPLGLKSRAGGDDPDDSRSNRNRYNL
jgi:hypothetical protein